MHHRPNILEYPTTRRIGAQALWGLTVVCCVCVAGGCYAPLVSHGVPARVLPDSFRFPQRTLAPPLNYANLTVPPPTDYLLGPNDVLEVTVPDLFPGAEVRPSRVQVMASGEISLPLVGRVNVGGMNLSEAQEAITKAYADGIFVEPRINVSLLEKNVVEVVVLGQVAAPGNWPLSNYQNDVGHALAAARGLTRDAGDFVEIHRRVSSDQGEPAADVGEQESEQMPRELGPHSEWGISRQMERHDPDPGDPKKILRIPLRGLPPGAINKEDVQLKAGDVVVVPRRRFDVFWVVGKLDESNLVRFSLGDRERELGAGLVLPRDRDIDVVTAVAMAGYIDPIDSPTTVTVHRTSIFGESLLIRVDLIKARYNRRETVLVQPGDIIYVNPDAQWWMRRGFDRIVDSLLIIPYSQAMGRWIGF